MRFEIRTLTRALSTLVVLFVLVFGASLDVSAQRRGRDGGRSHNRGRHLGWERGRRVGHHRRDNDDGSRRRRFVRRNRRSDRRSNWNNNDWRRRSSSSRDRADFRTRRFVRYSRY
jgi:hypothetical protein